MKIKKASEFKYLNKNAYCGEVIKIGPLQSTATGYRCYFALKLPRVSDKGAGTATDLAECVIWDTVAQEFDENVSVGDIIEVYGAYRCNRDKADPDRLHKFTNVIDFAVFEE